MANNTILQFALLGCGRIGEKHAKQMSLLGNLVACCDLDVSKSELFANKYNCVAFSDYGQMLSQSPSIDLIAICTPNGLHAAHTITALNSGINVLCEKPMALTTKDCKNMLDAAADSKKRIFVVKQNRYNPPVVALKELLAKERLGKVFSIQLNCFWNRNEEYYSDSWRGTRALDGGTLFTQFSHFIDLLYWLFGDVRQIVGFRGNLAHQNVIEFEDTGVIALHFNSGILGTINYTVNSYDKNMEGSLTIFGQKGTVKIGGSYLNKLEYQCIEDYEIPDVDSFTEPNQYGHYQGSMSNHHLVYANVMDVLQNDAPMHTTPEEGLKSVELIHRIYQNLQITAS